MKKYIIHFVLIWVAAAGLNSCSFLDVDQPDNLVKDDYWQTKEQVNAALTGVYTSLHNNLVKLIKWGDLRSEIYKVGTANSLGNETEFVQQDISTSNSLNDWSGVYQSINWVNSFLKNARSTMGKDPSITEAEMASWESEVYAIRALYYFYLVRTFRDVPIVLEAYESDTQNPYAAPSTETVVLDTVEADLKRALANAPETFDSPEKRFGRITKNAVRAIWADVKLWRGDYDGCLSLCTALENVYDNRMVPGKDWFTIFSQGNSSEAIFEYQYLSGKGVSSPLYNLYRTGSSNVFLSNYDYLEECISSIYPAQFENHTYGDTVRIDATFNPSAEVLKYVASSPYLPTEYRGTDNRNANFIFYRYREILLIKAEALAMKGDYPGAVATINRIRTATELPLIEDASTFGEGETFFENLLNERICELAYEGKHWFSQVRLARNTGYADLVVERNAQAAQLSLNGTVKLQTMRARLQDTESWFLPYYKTEVEKNPLLNQKTYYEGK